MRCWNPLFYGEFPFIIGYETAGPYVDLFVIDKSDRSSVRVRRLGEFNLRIDRGKLVQVAFNLALLFSEMIRLSPLSPVPSIMPYGVDTNEKRVVVLLDDRIERAIRESDAVTHADLERIYDIYKTLERLSPQDSEMTHLQTVLRLTKSPYDVTVELGPVGWQRYPSDEDAEVWLRQMLTALKAWHECGYSHGDVQWRNIVYVPTGVGTGYWLLIDMDESRQPDTTFINWSHEFHGSKLCFQHDLFQLGNLLAEISPKLPSYLETMKTLLLSSVGRREVTAEKALAKLADLTKNSGG